MDFNKNGDFKSTTNEKFSSKEKDILERNRKFFSSNKKYVNAMLDIIDSRSNISIRVLDWFVANYSKKNDTKYRIKINGYESTFNVNIEYKNQLSGYSKQYFDPFCRKKKVIYCCKCSDSGEIIKFETSIGQLNFFHWAIKNKIIQYVEKHLEEIEEDMKKTSLINKEKKIAALAAASIKSESEDEITYISDKPDPIICSSDDINSIHISPANLSSSKSDSDHKTKRQQLSRSVYEYGIKKSNVPIKLDFD